MALLLAIAGGAAGLAVGWWLGRSWRRDIAAGPGPVPHDASPSIADLLEDHPTGVVVAGPDGRIVYENAAATAMSGTHIGVLLDEAVERQIAAGRRGERADEVIELYGPPRTVLDVEARPIPGGGAVVFIEDISEQRRIDQVRTDLVSNISHELKTPIGALSVLAETLEDETDPATIRRVVARMQGEAARAARTIDDLMELSRIELGGERTVEAVRVVDVIRGALDRVTEMSAQRRIAIDADRPDATLVVRGDRRQLVSAVGNLVENAVKYSEPGGEVEVRARRDRGWAEISVIDHGAGIPQRDLPRIFERFYRVDRARSRMTGGTGLGLSIVRHVATSHAGDVLVTSSEGEGSTFTLRLPHGNDPGTDGRVDPRGAPGHVDSKELHEPTG